jgi:hypothetical protein
VDNERWELSDVLIYVLTGFLGHRVQIENKFNYASSRMAQYFWSLTHFIQIISKTERCTKYRHID